MGNSPSAERSRRITPSAITITAQSLATFLLACLGAGTTLAGSWEIQPRVALSEIYTDNVDLNPSGQEDDDLITEVTPGISLFRESSRLKVDVNYQAQVLKFVNEDDADKVNHGLDGSVSAELAEDFLFVDASGNVSQAIVDNRGARSVDAITGSGNLADTQAYSISPYIRQSIRDYAAGTLRYRFATTDSEDVVSDTDTHIVQANLESGRAFGPVAWGVNYFKSEEDRDTSDDFNEERYDYNLAYRVNAQFSLIAEGGEEDNEFVANEVPQNGTYWGVGASWTPNRYISITALDGDRLQSGALTLTPSPRTAMFVSYRDSEVGLNAGAVWTGGIRYQTRRSGWSLDYFEDTQTAQRLLEQELVGNIYVDRATGGLFARPAIIDDVQKSLEEGIFLGRALVNFGNIPTDSLIERKRAQATAAFQTAKSDFSFSVYNERRNFLSNILSVNVSATDEKTLGASGQWLLRFSGRSTASLTSAIERIEFGSDGREDDFWHIEAGVTREISRSMKGSVRYRFAQNESDDINEEYDENRLSAHLSIQF